LSTFRSPYSTCSGIAQSSSYPRGFEIRRCPQCTTVHKWSAKCPECGYIYQIKDRTVEEIYGELREITQGAEYENQKRFARRCGLNPVTIARFIKQKQLIAYGPRRFIKIKEGLARVEWLRENKYIRQKTRPGFDTRKRFAQRLGVRQGTVHNLIKKGLPINDFGLIPVEDGLEWLRREGLFTEDGKFIRQNARSTPGFDSRSHFAHRLGVAQKIIDSLIKKGLPINELRLIPIDPAMQWLRREGLLAKDGKYIGHKVRSNPGFDTRSRFAQRIGVNRITIRNWIKKGMPTTGESNLIPVDAALRWVKKNRPQHNCLEASDADAISPPAA